MRRLALGPRASITGVFFLNGLCFSAWYARVPAIQEQLELSPGELGIALFGAPAGLLAAQPLAGALTVRYGSRPLVAAAPLYLIAVVLPALAVDMVTLLLAVTVVGAANGVLDIAMNTQGVAVERTLRTRLFSSLHAAFSFGALAGAGSAAAVAAAGVDPLHTWRSTARSRPPWPCCSRGASCATRAGRRDLGSRVPLAVLPPWA